MSQSEIISNFDDLKDIYIDLDSDILKHKDVKSALYDSLNWNNDKNKIAIRTYLDLSVFSNS